VNPRDDRELREIGIKILNGYMERLDQLIVALQANLRVCRAITKFYRDELLQDRRLKARKLAWTTDKEFQAEIREHLDDFQDKMRWVCTSTQEMLRRAVVVRQMGTRRENAVRLLSETSPLPPGSVGFVADLSSTQLHQFIQIRDLRATRKLATASNKLAVVTTMDSSTMRAFSAMTLILLPISIVSTVFSSGIVDFQAGSGGLVGSWSGPAALWWAGITIVLTVLVRWLGEMWRDHAMATTAARAREASDDGFWMPRRTASHHHESWMTPALRVIREARSSAQDYASRICFRYGLVVAPLKGLLARYKSARSRGPPSPGPKAPPPHHSPYSGDQHAQVVQAKEQPPLSHSTPPPIMSARSGPPAGDAEEPVHIDGVELDQLNHVSPQQAQTLEISAATASPGNEEPGSKAFDQASEAERGLLPVVRVAESKEEAINGTDMEGQER
jgi:hypothetical protein